MRYPVSEPTHRYATGYRSVSPPPVKSRPPENRTALEHPEPRMTPPDPPALILGGDGEIPETRLLPQPDVEQPREILWPNGQVLAAQMCVWNATTGQPELWDGSGSGGGGGSIPVPLPVQVTDQPMTFRQVPPNTNLAVQAFTVASGDSSQSVIPSSGTQTIKVHQAYVVVNAAGTIRVQPTSGDPFLGETTVRPGSTFVFDYSPIPWFVGAAGGDLLITGVQLVLPSGVSGLAAGYGRIWWTYE